MDNENNENKKTFSSQLNTERSFGSDTNVVLSVREKLFYGFGNFGYNWTYPIAMSFLMIFFTDSAGISAGTAGTFMLICRIWDAINDPLIGSLADKTTTKRGRYKPWLISAIPLIFCSAFVFYVIPGKEGTLTQHVFSFIMYFLLVTFFTGTNVPLDSLLASLTTNAASRASAVGFQTSLGQTSSIFVSALFMPLVIFLMPKTNGQGFFYGALIFAVCTIPFFIMCYFGCKERVFLPKEQMKLTWPQRFSLFKLGPFRCLFFTFLMWGLYGGVIGISRTYWFKYQIGDESLFAFDMTCWTVGMFAACILYTVFFSRIFKNKKTWPMLTSLLGGGLMIIMQFIPWSAANIGLHNVLMIFVGIGCGGVISGSYSILPDISEYAQYHLKIRPTAFIGSLVFLMTQFGQSLIGAIFGWILEATHYVPNEAIQTPATLFTVNSFMHGFSGIFLVIIFVVMSQYKLTREMHVGIVEKLSRGEHAAEGERP
jgi:sugar (glycoside-pentoside-hexuronide) transporter